MYLAAAELTVEAVLSAALLAGVESAVCLRRFYLVEKVFFETGLIDGDDNDGGEGDNDGMHGFIV